MRPALRASPQSPWTGLEPHPEVRRLLLLTLVLLSLWFSDLRGPIPAEEGARRKLGDRRDLPPGLQGWVDDLLPQPLRARRRLQPSPAAAPPRARRRGSC